jgi:hypothetical protein
VTQQRSVKGKFIATNAYVKNTEKSQINDLEKEHIRPNLAGEN